MTTLKFLKTFLCPEDRLKPDLPHKQHQCPQSHFSAGKERQQLPGSAQADSSPAPVPAMPLGTFPVVSTGSGSVGRLPHGALHPCFVLCLQMWFLLPPSVWGRNKVQGFPSPALTASAGCEMLSSSCWTPRSPQREVQSELDLSLQNQNRPEQAICYWCHLWVGFWEGKRCCCTSASHSEGSGQPSQQGRFVEESEDASGSYSPSNMSFPAVAYAASLLPPALPGICSPERAPSLVSATSGDRLHLTAWCSAG